MFRAARSRTRRAVVAVSPRLVPGAALVTAVLLTAAAPASADASIIRGQGRDACTHNYVCLYENWDYNAPTSARILRTTEDISRLDDYFFNDITSSVVNNSRYIVRIYPDYDFKGVPVTLLPGESISFNNGNGFNDVASSVKFLPYTTG
ncbi:peptidase inhibitor family I36 protein [Streptomyces sp. NPDC020192]|uniref:peptidase inhibitor family I36 protein n=1 Tax=Streptomyces sp. NPDC020192 TaxID=3365066 RepID=UPI0037914BC8